MTGKQQSQETQLASAQSAATNTPADIEEEKTPQRFTIFCGTYEGAVLGLVGDLQKLDLKYAFKPSTNSLKCMEVSGKYLLVGGFDEYLRIYDLKRQRECGILDSHVGTITNIKHHKSIVFSCAEDGLIKAWKMKEFGLLHTLKEHKAAVNDIAVHKSGRILVSVSKDQRLIIWNLLNAKKVFSMNLKYNPYKVEMTEKNILTMSDYEIHVIDLETNQEITVLKDEKQVALNDFQIFKEHYVVVGDNNGFVKIWDIRTKQNVSFKAHETRVKKLSICEVDGIDIIVTISTSGEIHIFDALIILREIETISESKELKDLQPIYHVDTLNRLTTLSVYLGAAAEKEDQEEEAEEQEDIKLKEEQEKNMKKKENNKHNNNKGKQVKVTISRDGEEGTTSSKSFIVDKNSTAKRNKQILKKQKKLEKKKLEKEAGKNGANASNDSSKVEQKKEQSQGKQANNKNNGDKQQKPQQKQGKQNQQQQNNKANKAEKQEITQKNGKKIQEEKSVNVPEKTKKIKKSVRFQ